MPKVSFTGPDGRDYSFEAPQGADQKFIDATIRQIVLDNVDTSQARGGFGAAFGAGVEGVKSAGAALLGRTGVISPETAEQYMAEREAAQRQSFAPTQEGWTGAPVTKTLETLGGSLPFMVAPVVGAAAGALAAGTAPAWLAAGLGATALSGIQFTGTNLQRQMDEGKRLEETDLVAAGAAAVPQALLDTVALRYIPGVRRIFGEIGKDLTEDQAKKIIERGILANMGAAGAKTASAEALTEVGQQTLERFQAGLQVLDDKGKEELIESAIGGGVLGFLFGVPGVVGVRGAAERRILEAEEKRQAAAAQAEAAQIGPQPPAPTVPGLEQRFLTAEEARIQKQRDALERFGLESEFPEGISPSSTLSREERQREAQRQIDAGRLPDTAITARTGLGAPNELDRRTFDAQFPGITQEQAAQMYPGELFPMERLVAERAARGIQGPPTPEVTPEVAPETAPVGQQLELGLPEPSRIASPEITRLVAEQNEREIAAVRAAREEEQRLAEIKLRSDIAELDARIQAKEQKTAEDRRLGLLLPLIEDPNISSISSAFDRALKQAGIRDTEFTERERNLIQRAQDVRAATTPEPTPTAATPETTTAPQRAPEQLTLPGVLGKQAAKKLGKTRPVAPDATLEPTVLGPTPVIDEQALDTLKLPKTSMLRKRLLGKDLSDPQQNQEVNTELRAALQNTRLPKETRDAIRDVIEQSAFTRQGELFGPEVKVEGQRTSRVLPQPKAPEGAPDVTPATAPTAVEPTPVGQPSEPSVGVDNVGVEPTPAQEATAGAVSEPELGGLAGADAGVTPDVGRGTTLPSSVRDSILKKAEEVGSMCSFMNCKLFAQQVSGIPEITSLPKVKKAQIGDIYAWPNGSHYAVDIGDGEVIEVEGWGESPRVSKLSELEEEMSPAESIYRPPVGTYTPEKIQSSELPAKAKKALVKKAISQTSKRGESAPGAAETATPQQQLLNNDPFAAAINQIAKATEGVKEAPTAQEPKAKLNKYETARKEGLNWGKVSKLVNVDALPLQNQLDQSVITQLQNNNVVGALNELAGRLKGPMAQIAKRLAALMDGVQVQIVDDAAMRRRVFERTGKVETNVKGVFFGADNTIYINSELGLDAHTLLHEATHAAVDKILGNKSHPLTKQLQKLYDDVKGGLGTAYGATDLKEFASEFMSNPEFRAMLDRLYPDGGQISALRRMVNSVMNFLRSLIGMQPKAVESAFNVADNLMYSLTEPGQTALQPLMTMNQASFLKTGDQPIAAVPLMDKALPFMNQDQRDNLRMLMNERGVGGAKSLVRMSLPLNALVDVAKNLLPSATRVQELIHQRMGTENKRHQMIEPIEQEANQFAKKASLDTMTKFNNVVYDSTIEGVDPTKPRDTYKGDTEKLKVWDTLSPQFKALPPEGQRLYTRMRDTYKELYKQIVNVVDQRLDSATSDAETNKRIKKDILAKLRDAAGQIDPYFPLTRDGDYWISYSLQGGGKSDFVVEAFKTPAARDRAMAAIRQDENFVEGSLELYAKKDQINYANAPSGSFMNSVLSVLKVNKVDPNVTQEMMNLFLNSLPASAFAQSFRKRKGVAGFERDSIKAFRSKVYNISRQLANIEYGSKLNDARDALNAEADQAYRAGNEAARGYKDEFNKRIDFAISPSVDRWSQIATSYGFLATLGFNLSSALVNLSQIPLMVLPYYGGKYGLGATMKAIGKATKLYMNSGFSQDRETILGDRRRMRVAPSLQNYTFKDGDPYKYLVEVAQDLGQMNRSQTYDILDVTGNDSPLAKVNAASGFIFHHGERMNREIALAAAFELEMQKLGKNPSPDALRGAAKRAVEMTELTNGGIAAAAAPRIAQNSLGRVLFMYKRYGVSMYYAMFKMARDMLRGESPEVRRAGMKQIAGIFLSAGMLAGVQGLPLYGIGALIYNMFKEDDEDPADAAVRKYLGEGLFKGPVNLLTGADIASRVGLSDLLFRDNPVKREQEPMAELMEFIGGPVYSVTNRALRGTKDIKEGEIWRGVEQILPSAFGNVMKSIRFATEGVNTRRGDPVLEDLGFGSSVAQFFGFAPAEYTRQLEINSVEKGKERAVTETRTKLLRQLYMSLREEDSEGTQDILAKISEFNERHPTVAITPSSVRRSMKQHARTTAQMYNGVTYNKKYLPEFLQSRAEYDEE